MTTTPQDRDDSPHTTARGFDYLQPVPSAYGGQGTVSESSAASGPHLWLDVECPANLNEPEGPTVEAILHLTAEHAWRLAEQLMTLVRDHYQGDARPESRIADFTDEHQTAELTKARQALDVLRDRIEDAGSMMVTAYVRDALEGGTARSVAEYVRLEQEQAGQDRK